jgi:hypothetical protein
VAADGDINETPDLELGPAGRARLYREQAEALHAQMEATELPLLREKLRAAADRFLALAAAEETILARRDGGGVRTDVLIDQAAGRLLEFLRGGAKRA